MQAWSTVSKAGKTMPRFQGHNHSSMSRGISRSQRAALQRGISQPLGNPNPFRPKLADDMAKQEEDGGGSIFDAMEFSYSDMVEIIDMGMDFLVLR